jgi:SNF2 family DNA or RNA helicase
VVPEVRALPAEKRLAAAERIRTARDFELPELKYFNHEPCARHDSVDQGQSQIPPCRSCGVHFRRHQRVGVAWQYVRGKGLIADQTGTGKTVQAAGLIAMLKEAGELDFDEYEALVICRPSVLHQWEAELRRLLPQLDISVAAGNKAVRHTTYDVVWDVLIIGYQTFCNDLQQILARPIRAVIVDDVDPLRNPNNRTANAINALASQVDRVTVMTATPLQKQLDELYANLMPVGVVEVLGTPSQYRRRFVREEWTKVYSPHAGRMVNTREVVGYKNLDEFQALVAPLVLRRTPDHIDDVELPVITPHNVYLDLLPAQAARYADLKSGVLKLLQDEGDRVKQTKAGAAFMLGAQICAGLATLGEKDGPGTSAKLDWIMRVLTGDLADEKVVVFCNFIKTVEALRDRLRAAGIDFSLIWGREADKNVRAAAVTKFWDDPACRVLLGTTAIEQGLNLQVSRHLINVDQIMNPARMQQLAGRIRRDGSAYRTVYVHNLLTRGTQEESYLGLLAREQALADHVWGESNQLYERLSPIALLELIGNSGRSR